MLIFFLFYMYNVLNFIVYCRQILAHMVSTLHSFSLKIFFFDDFAIHHSLSPSIFPDFIFTNVRVCKIQLLNLQAWIMRQKIIWDVKMVVTFLRYSCIFIVLLLVLFVYACV